MNGDILLARLKKVRQTKPGHWAACCPAHDDKSPSMTVKDAGDRILLYCFSGCTPDQIIAAVGLQWRDLFEDDGKAAYGAATASPPRLPPVDPVEIERMILQVACEDQKNGRTHDIQDRARIRLAKERLTFTD